MARKRRLAAFFCAPHGAGERPRANREKNQEKQKKGTEGAKKWRKSGANAFLRLSGTCTGPSGAR
jgi:hypothetical protein